MQKIDQTATCFKNHFYRYIVNWSTLVLANMTVSQAKNESLSHLSENTVRERHKRERESVRVK